MTLRYLSYQFTQFLTLVSRCVIALGSLNVILDLSNDLLGGCGY